jgi:hypothetical protein
MTSWFEFNERREPMGDVVEFTPADREIEHVDSTTIVEKIELTDALKQLFLAQGYTFGDDDDSREI